MNEHVDGVGIASLTVVELVGGIADDLVAYSQAKIATVLGHSGRSVLRSRLRVVRHGDPARPRPVSAHLNVDLAGRTVRAHVDAVTPREAVDRIVDRLAHQLERVGRGWRAGRHGTHQGHPHGPDAVRGTHSPERASLRHRVPAEAADVPAGTVDVVDDFVDVPAYSIDVHVLPDEGGDGGPR